MRTPASNDSCPLCHCDQLYRRPFNQKDVDRAEKLLENYEWCLGMFFRNLYQKHAPTFAELQTCWDQNRIEASPILNWW